MIGAAAKLIEERADLFKHLLTLETGQPAMIVDMLQYASALSWLQYYAGAADKFSWKEIRDGIYGQTLVTREPVGVVGAIVAWNVPLFLAANKLGPGLAGRLHRRAQARGRNTVEHQCAGRGVRRGRPARGRAVGGPGRPGDWPGADRQSRRWTSSRSPAARRSARKSASWPPRSSSRARWNSAASRPRSFSRTRIWIRHCRCWSSPA